MQWQQAEAGGAPPVLPAIAQGAHPRGCREAPEGMAQRRAGHRNAVQRNFHQDKGQAFGAEASP